MNRFIATSLAILIFSAPAAWALDTGFALAPSADHVLMDDNGHGIHIDGQTVVIENRDGDDARISNSGNLTVNGKTVAVSASQKRLLQRYNQTVKDIRTKGIDLGAHAASFAMTVAGDAIAALFSGASEEEIDRHAKAEADKFKLQALPLCKDVQTLKQIQDQLVAGIPAFQPFDVIEAKDAEDCERDIKSSDD